MIDIAVGIIVAVIVLVVILANPHRIDKCD